MKKEDADVIIGLVKKNMRISIGRISQKELMSNKFVTDLFLTFEIVNKTKPPSSATANRAKVQELVANNTIPYSGRSRYPNFCVDEFIREFNTQFKLKPRPTDTNKRTMKKVVKKSIINLLIIIMLFASSCSDDKINTEETRQQLRDEIMAMSRMNNDIKVNLPKQQNASDTLMLFLQSTHDTYTRNILIQDIQELNEAIEKNKVSFGDNIFKIDQNKRRLLRLENKTEPVVLVSDSVISYDIGEDSIIKNLVPMDSSDIMNGSSP